MTTQDGANLNEPIVGGRVAQKWSITVDIKNYNIHSYGVKQGDTLGAG